ncbi:SCO family protein [Cereibacter changlensis]|uniref:SCO family protein n=1 Tax=Cereibacter changlensis TaxID=402884 RepID=A0A4U0YZP9_9RHOB|nr:SCO family protein [Cereibacter changlensis]TKA98410.1 SCO family protein [Cereibacter changlensis]
MRLTFLQKTLRGLIGVAALAFVWLLLWADYRADQADEQEPAFRAAFELTDHTGVVRTQKDYAGRWMLAFFGFANWSDVCSTTLAEVAAVMDGPAEDAAQVQPLFTTIDPKHDTPSALADFMPSFEAGIVGLTGTPDHFNRTADSFHIFIERVQEAAAPDGYTMGHSSQLFLFDPEDGYLKAWSYGTPGEEIRDDLRGRAA